MLGTIYRILEVETELLKSLLKACAPEVITPTTRRCLCDIADALIQPLKLRIETLLRGHNSNCVVLFRLASLFLYYACQFE